MKTNDEMNEGVLEKAKLVLLGAMCGDIIGSAYEFRPTKFLNFPLFKPVSRLTDDSVCSIGIADALLVAASHSTDKTTSKAINTTSEDYAAENASEAAKFEEAPFTECLQRWCRKYPRAGYGGHFAYWIMLDEPLPYNSWGNGSAMRVSPVGAIAQDMNEVMTLAKASASVTHNHREGVKGAQATAAAIYLALRGANKEEIKTFIETEFGYNLSRKYSDIQPDYSFDVSCQGSVPEAIICFLTADDYESTIRHCVAMGGDADTMGAIAGGIAAAYYGEIPEYILSECEKLIPNDMKEVIKRFNNLLTTIYTK